MIKYIVLVGFLIIGCNSNKSCLIFTDDNSKEIKRIIYSNVSDDGFGTGRWIINNKNQIESIRDILCNGKPINNSKVILSEKLLIIYENGDTLRILKKGSYISTLNGDYNIDNSAFSKALFNL